MSALGAASAFGWGFVAASSLIIGGLLALWPRVGRRANGLITGFGVGVLVSAVAYELVQEAYRVSSDGVPIAAGLTVGAVTFFVGDDLIDRMGGAERKRSSVSGAPGSPLAIVLGIILDGIPESAVIGLTLVAGGGVTLALLAAVLISNVPEAVAATTGLRARGWPGRNILGLWTGVAIVSGLAAIGGYALGSETSPTVLAFSNAFAGGAILTMLADTMMPEAFAEGGKAVGLVTTLGFGVAFAMSALT
jgi:zinc transporter, ZIP family